MNCKLNKTKSTSVSTQEKRCEDVYLRLPESVSVSSQRVSKSINKKKEKVRRTEKGDMMRNINREIE